MTANHESLNESLQFQMSLLRLALVPHAGSSHTSPDTRAADELARLAERVPVNSPAQGD